MTSLTDMEPDGPEESGGLRVPSNPLPDPEGVKHLTVSLLSQKRTVIIDTTVFDNESYSGCKLGLGWPHPQPACLH